MQEKIKHLEFVQQIIGRMAKNSFLLKGWSITLILGLISFSEICSYVLVLIVIIFFLLDTYFLFQEKNFIDLYNNIRNGVTKNFEIKPIASMNNFLKAIISIPNLLFYLLILFIIFLTY